MALGRLEADPGLEGGRTRRLVLFILRWLLRTRSFWQGSEWEAGGRLCWCLMGWLSYCPVTWVILKQLLRLLVLALLRVPGLSCAAYSAAEELMRRGHLCFGL